MGAGCVLCGRFAAQLWVLLEQPVALVGQAPGHPAALLACVPQATAIAALTCMAYYQRCCSDVVCQRRREVKVPASKDVCT